MFLQIKAGGVYAKLSDPVCNWCGFPGISFGKQPEKRMVPTKHWWSTILLSAGEN
jgi:hypothetical protein